MGLWSAPSLSAPLLITRGIMKIRTFGLFIAPFVTGVMWLLTSLPIGIIFGLFSVAFFANSKFLREDVANGKTARALIAAAVNYPCMLIALSALLHWFGQDNTLALANVISEKRDLFFAGSAVVGLLFLGGLLFAMTRRLKH